MKKKAVENEPGKRFRTLYALRCVRVSVAIALTVFASTKFSFAQGYNLGAFWRSQTNNPIALVQSAGDSQDSPTLTLPGASKTGDLMVVTVWGEATTASEFTGANVTDSFGNTYVLANSNTFENYAYTGLFYAKNIQAPSSTPITVTVNFPNLTGGDDGDPGVSAAEFSGIDRSNPLDQTANSSGGYQATSPTSLSTATTGTTTKAYELIVATVSADNQIYLTPTGIPLFDSLVSEVHNGVVSAGEFDYAVVFSTGSYADNWSMRSLDAAFGGYASAIATFKGLQTASNLPTATKIAISSTAQSLQTHQCSSVVNLVSENASNQPTQVGADQVIALSGTGLSFYSDSGCSLPISSVTFTSVGSTTQSFYFAATTPGTIALTATPTSLATVTQNETITLVNGTWLGNGGNSNWSNPSNWSGGSVPGTYQTGIFDSNCISCNATLDSVVVGSSLATYPSYTGTITDTAANADLSNVSLGGGTFNGGSVTLIVGAGFYYSPTATFNGQTGTVQFGDASSATFTLSSSGGSPTFNNLIMDNQGTEAWATIVVTGNWYVSGDLTISNIATTSSHDLPLNGTYFQGPNNTIFVAGNITANSGGGGNLNLVMNGNNNTQTLTGSSAGILPNLTIAHTGSGGVNLAGTIVIDGTLTQTSGTVNPGTSTVQMGRNDSARDSQGNLYANTMNFYNLVFSKAAANSNVQFFEGTFNILNNFTVADSGSWSSLFTCGSSQVIVNLSGNLSLGSLGLTNYCAPVFNFVGTGAQTISSAGGGLGVGTVEITKTGGSLSLSNNVTSPLSSWTIQQGSLNLNGYVLNVAYGLTIGAAGTLNCDGGCGGTPGSPSPPASMPSGCGFGAGDLLCEGLNNSSGGVVNP